MDVQMPIMNGIDAVKEIRSIEKETQVETPLVEERDKNKTQKGHPGALYPIRIPRTNIIVLTGLDNPEDHSAAMKGGADLFLTKVGAHPTTPGHLTFLLKLYIFSFMQPVSMKKLHKYIQEVQEARIALARQTAEINPSASTVTSYDTGRTLDQSCEGAPVVSSVQDPPSKRREEQREAMDHLGKAFGGG